MKSTNPIRQPWDGQLIQPADIRPEVQEARQQLHDDLVRRWKTEIPESLKRFYLTATQLDPRQRKLSFPGLTAWERHEAQEWFISEFDALLWNKTPPASAATPTATIPGIFSSRS
ncbi:hypothetical protein AB1Y20_017490 [Prymnesium parvum]|uniref:Uncharacterized protein n=1 Tax=Prymnesium parvum TaxID=97485 RepID=A0AB34JP85_PRYPA